MEEFGIVIAAAPVLVITIFFLILIVYRIYDASNPVTSDMNIDPNEIGIDGLS